MRGTPFYEPELTGEFLIAFILYADTLLSITQIAGLLSPCFTTLHDQLREFETAFCRGFPTVWERLQPAYKAVKASVQESDVIYCDETGFPVDGDQHWVWTFVTDEDVFYTIDESSGSQVLEDVFGEFVAEAATLSCDGWSAYPSYHGKLQRCWAHLLREATYVAERHEEAEPISEILHDLHDDLTAFDEEDPPASARSGGGRKQRCVWRSW